MKRRVVGFLVLVAMMVAIPAGAGEVITRRASGEVVATDMQATPNTIVIKTKNWKGQDFIIGAAIEKDTIVMVDNKKTSLMNIRIGDRVDIVYERNLRVIAKSIKVKR